MNALTNLLVPFLGDRLRRDVAAIRAPMAELGQGKSIKRWPHGRQLATTDAEREYYDAIGVVMNKHAHATPFFVLSPREDDALIWFLACRALEQAKALVGLMQNLAASPRATQG
jgi:hypothetical protein